LRITKKFIAVSVAVVAAPGGGILVSSAADAAEPTPKTIAAGTPLGQGSITGWHLKDGTIYGADINPAVVKWFTGTWDNTVTTNSVKDGALGEVDLNAAVRAKLNASGPTYLKHWGPLNRNVLGNGRSELGNTSTAAPLGDGALNIDTPSAADKASFGNEVDFSGDLVKDISKLGISVYTTGENAARGNNMPSITFEINPRITGSDRTYSSMVFAPNNSTSNVWTALDATDDSLGKVWGLTGADMPCNINGARCTWTELQAALNDGGEDAIVNSLAVGKGRDYEFHGAVDKLVYNAKTYNFEAAGVTAS
jgi:hypothetical protein